MLELTLSKHSLDTLIGLRIQNVNQEVRQMLVVAILGCLVLAFVVTLSRKDKLTLRYTLGWIAVSSLGILSGLLVPVVKPVSDSLGLSAVAFVALVAVAFLLLISIQLSISISGMQRQIRAITEDVARLRLKLSGDSFHSDSDI